MYAHDGGDAIYMPQPEGLVAYNTITYVKGVGLSIRCIAVPGSRWPEWVEDVEHTGVCGCAPPAVWQFTAIDGARVVLAHTIDVHEAMFFLQNPDELFDPDRTGQDFGQMTQDLVLVPESEGLQMVLTEYTGWLNANSNDSEPGGLTYSEVTDADIDSLLTEFFRSDDSPTE